MAHDIQRIIAKKPLDCATVTAGLSGDGSAWKLRLGEIAAASGIPARLALNPLVVRHSAVVGSTGSGKSNFVAVLLQAITTQGYPSARVLVIDPHGEYASAIGEHGRVFRGRPKLDRGEFALGVPYAAL